MPLEITSPASPLTGEVPNRGDTWISWHRLVLGLITPGVSTLDNMPLTDHFREMVESLKALGYSWKEEGAKKEDAQLKEGATFIVEGKPGSPKLLEDPVPVRHEVCLMTLAGLFSGYENGNSLVFNNQWIPESSFALLEKLFDTRVLREHKEGQKTERTVSVYALKKNAALKFRDQYFAKCALLYHRLASGEAGSEEVTQSGPDHLERALDRLSDKITYHPAREDNLSELEKRMLRAMGKVEKPAQTIDFEAGFQLHPGSVKIPGDASQCAIYSLAAGLLRGWDLQCPYAVLNPTRITFLNALKRMGADIQYTARKEKDGETVGNVHVKYAELTGRKFDFKTLEGMREEIPLLLVAGAFAEGKTIIRNISHLRVYDRDLLKLMIRDLKSAQVEIGEVEDGLVIKGKDSYKAVPLTTHGHPMIGFAYLVFLLRAVGSARLNDTECLERLFPGLAKILLKTAN